MGQKINKSFLVFTALAALGVGLVGYFAYQDYLLKNERSDLESEISQTQKDFIDTTSKLNGQIKDLNDIIVSTKETLATTTAALSDSEAKYNNTVSDLGQQVSEAQTRIGTLEKLSQTDPELLKKYSKNYFLNENYVPASLTKATSCPAASSAIILSAEARSLC